MGKIVEHIWIQKYRPSKIQEVILPEKIRNELLGYLNDGQLPNLIFYGTAGIGKTSVAKILIDELGSDSIEINGSLDTSIDEVRTTVMRFSTTVSLTATNPVKVCFITEADGFSQQAQNSLKQIIEKFSKNVRFIFDTNHVEKLVEPLRSRCVEIDFNPVKSDHQGMMKSFMQRSMMILDEENVTYDKKVLANIIKTDFPDMRKIINNLQKFSVSGELVLGESSVDEQFSDLLEKIKSKRYNDIRTSISTISNYDNMILKIFSSLDKIFKKEDIPQVVLILAEANFQSGFCISKEINFLNMVTKLMQSGVEIEPQ